jgi:hypothetical protein
LQRHATKQLALSVRQALEAKSVTQEEVGRIIGRAQSYASLRIKGLKPWTIDELDKLAPILGYNDVFALVNAMRQTQVNVDTDGHFIDSDMAQSMSGWSVDEQAAYVASHLDQFDVAAKKGDIEREQEAFEDLP